MDLTSQKAIPRELSPLTLSGSPRERVHWGWSLCDLTWSSLCANSSIPRASSNTICASCLISQPPTARIRVGNERRTKGWKGKTGMRCPQEPLKSSDTCLGISGGQEPVQGVHVTKRDRRGRSQKPRLDDRMPFI